MPRAGAYGKPGRADAAIFLALLLAALAIVVLTDAPGPASVLVGEVFAPVSSPEAEGVAYKDGIARVNINEASEEMLMLLPGIGEVLSKRIVEYREENGPFASEEGILEVYGIGEGLLARIRERICVGE